MWENIDSASKDCSRVLLIDDIDKWAYFGRWEPDYGEDGMWIEDDGSIPDYQPTLWLNLIYPWAS